MKPIVEDYKRAIITLARYRQKAVKTGMSETKDHTDSFETIQRLQSFLESSDLNFIRTSIFEEYDKYKTPKDYHSNIYSFESADGVFLTQCYKYYADKDADLYDFYKIELYKKLCLSLIETKENKQCNTNDALYLLKSIRSIHDNYDTVTPKTMPLYGEAPLINRHLVRLENQLEQFQEIPHEFLSYYEMNAIIPIIEDIGEKAYQQNDTLCALFITTSRYLQKNASTDNTMINKNSQIDTTNYQKTIARIRPSTWN